MLTGRRVFPSKDWRTLLEEHLHREPDWPQQFQPDLPDSVCNALLRGLAKDPEQRFQSCEAFAVALGSQILSSPVASIEIIREMRIDRIKWRGSGLGLGNRMKSDVHLALTRDSLWMSRLDEVFRVPFAHRGNH
jgi:serine/threonine protein kinase